MYKHRFPLDDLEYSLQRLNRIMGRRRLSFNPYTVSDERLMEIVETTGWGNEYDIVQIVKVYFTRLREVKDVSRFDGIYMRVGNSSDEVFLSAWQLKYGVTASDTLNRERSMLGKRIIRNDDDVEWLVGKTAFVSHTIPGHLPDGKERVAYRMHRLKGDLVKDAATVRHAMCEAKVYMLRRILEHPESYNYLDCNPGFFDYRSRIELAIKLIENFHKVEIPKD